MNISSSDTSTYTNAAYSSKGFSGMVSGLDTESLVQSMLSSIQTKIDKQNQQKQQLLWKQEIYRDVIKDINNFQSKFFSLTSSTSLRLNSFYNSLKVSSSSSAVSVSSTSNSVSGEFKVQVARLATATSVTSSKAGSGEIDVSGDKASSFEYDRTVNVKIGDDVHTVDLKGAADANEVCQRINAAAGKDIVSVKTETVYKDDDGNALTFNEDENKYYDASGNEYTGNVNNSEEVRGLLFNSDSEFEISGSSAGMAILGLNGTVKSTVAVDDDGNEISGQFKAESNVVNPQFAEVGKVNGTVDITLDGVKKSISITENESMEDFQKKVQSAFGNSVKFNNDGNGNYSISVDGKGRNLTMSANAETMEAMGFAKGTTTVSNQIVRSDKVGKLGVGDPADSETTYSFNVNGQKIEYTAADSISSIMNKVNSSGAGVKMTYDELSDTFKIQSNSTGSGYDVNITDDEQGLFSKLGFSMNGGSIEEASVKKGQNAVVNINGVTVERANNDFTYNGINISAKSVTGTYEVGADGEFVENSDGSLKTVAGTIENAAEITTSKDTDKLVDTFKSFVEEYNNLIEKLNKYTHEDASYKKYPPLTDAQKKQMTEKEIELWEEKSKEGLLRRDKDVSSFLTDMRSAIYSCKSNGFILSNFGIDTSSNWQDFGKLEIDEDKLRSMLETNADDFRNLFTGDNGLATKLNDVCNKAANTSSGSPGALVSLAGVVGKGTEKSNTIQTRLDAISKKLESLNLLYEKRKERYWKQFNSLETALANMDSQSSWLTNMMGY